MSPKVEEQVMHRFGGGGRTFQREGTENVKNPKKRTNLDCYHNTKKGTVARAEWQKFMRSYF